MEAVPRLPMISFVLKVSPDNTYFGPRLKQYISEAYREDSESYSNEMHQLDGLRSAAVRPAVDPSGCTALKRYFCQLRSLQSRFPMAKGQPAAVSFSWKDLYANMVCSLADIRFEMVCILYNIGALHSQLGAADPRTSSDGLKAACTHYQVAAWTFQYLREHYPQPSGVDLAPDIMKWFQEMCFAQAQECILEKSMQDTKKPSVIGSVAMQVLVFYRNAQSLLGPSSGTDTIYETIGSKLYNYFSRYLTFKTAYIHCLVYLYQGMNAEDQQNMGERVAYFQASLDKLNEAKKLSKNMTDNEMITNALTFMNDVVEGKRKAAKNENEFIYHEEVPDKSLLADPKPACLVKGIAINFNDAEVSGTDIFSRLVPMGAHEASSMYSEEKAKLLRQVVTSAEAKNSDLTVFMSSLQLDQLNVLETEQKLPQELIDRCAAMNAKTEVIQTLVDSMNSLAEIITDVESNLTELKGMIAEEKNSEAEYQKVIGPRPPSIVSTDLSRECNKYHEAHLRTSDSNQVLHKAMLLHLTNLRMLSLPLDELDQKIPCIDRIEGLDRSLITEMKKVVDKVKEMQVQRDTLLSQLRDAVNADDITSQLLARSGEPLDDIFKEELNKHLPQVKIIEQNLAAQENIINRLTSVYARYGDTRREVSEVIRKRDALINALVTSYDTHEDLLAKSQKGLEFYRKLLNNINNLMSRVKSVCQVQQEERTQLLAKLAKPAQIQSKLSAVSPDIKQVANPTNAPSGAPKLKDYLPYMKNRKGNAMAPLPDIIDIPQSSAYTNSYHPTENQFANPEYIYSQQSQYQYADPNYTYPPQVSQGYGPMSDNQYYAGQPVNTGTDTGHSYNAQQTYNQPQLDPTQTAISDSIHNIPTQTNYYSNINQQNIANTDGNMRSYPSQLPSVGGQYGYQTTHTSEQNYSMPPANNTQMQDFSSSQIQNYQTVPSDYDLTMKMSQIQIHDPVMTNVENYSYSTPSSNYNQGMTYPQSIDYSQTYFTPNQYPPTPSSDISTYSLTLRADTNISSSQTQNTTLFPYKESANDAQPVKTEVPAQVVYNPTPEPQNDLSQYDANVNPYGYMNPSVSPYLQSYISPNVECVDPNGQTNAMLDQPIRSHMSGQAFPVEPSSTSPKMYAVNDESHNPSGTLPVNQNFITGNVQTENQYAQMYQSSQNHPGYSFNCHSGVYEYNYGYSGSSMNDVNTPEQDYVYQNNVYTNAGTYGTVQSDSVPNNGLSGTEQNNYVTNNDTVHINNDAYTAVQKDSVTNYGHYSTVQNNCGANNSVLYNDAIQSNSVVTDETFINGAGPSDQITPSAEHPVPVTAQNVCSESNTVASSDVKQEVSIEPQIQTTEKVKIESKPETKKESIMDLLADIDFQVEQSTLMPEIKVPPVSELVLSKKKMIVQNREVVQPQPIEEPQIKTVPLIPDIKEIERPPKRDIFADKATKFSKESFEEMKQTAGLKTGDMQDPLSFLDPLWSLKKK